MMGTMKMLTLTALFGVGAALPHTMGAPGCEAKVEQLKEHLDAAVTTLDSLNAQCKELRCLSLSLFLGVVI